MKGKTIAAAACAAVFFGTGAYGFEASEIMIQGDAVVNAPKDSFIVSTMVLVDKNGFKNERKLEMYQREGDYRLIRFLAPADQKGIGFLALPGDLMYLYLPAFHKIRQIASHVKNQSFAGTDFTYDDLSEFEFSKTHRGELLEEQDGAYVLELTPTNSAGKDYSRLKVWYSKDNFYPKRIEYYDKSGNLWKIMERKRIEKVNGYWISLEMNLKDLKTNHATVSTVDKVEFDNGLSDEIFSKRNLQRTQ
jgi:outer membrane lipoprotein-sorting protein